MTAAEASEFKLGRRIGVVTFFRVVLCWAPKKDGKCGTETMKHKQVCSRKCYEAVLKAIGDEPDERQKILLEFAETETEAKRGSVSDEGDEYDQW